MRRPARRFRVSFAFLATVQAAAPPAAALADAAYAQDSQWVGLHVDDHTGKHDHPPHRDDCIFCQFLGHHALAPGRTTPERGVVRLAEFVLPGPVCPVRRLLPHLPDSRAPPLA